MMTRTQKTTILEMRAEGFTYKAIAEHMGMSLGSVKMFVSRHNRADERRCEQCGKLLPKGAGAAQRFCSAKCKTMWWNQTSRPGMRPALPHTAMRPPGAYARGLHN